MTVSTRAVVRSFTESKTTEVQTSNVGFTSEVSDYLVVHTGPAPVLFAEEREKERQKDGRKDRKEGRKNER